MKMTPRGRAALVLGLVLVVVAIVAGGALLLVRGRE